MPISTSMHLFRLPVPELYPFARMAQRTPEDRLLFYEPFLQTIKSEEEIMRKTDS